MIALFKKISLTQWIMISIAVGVLIGWQFPVWSQNLQVVSDIFLKLIKCIIVPLIFSTLVIGIAAHSDDLKAVGRLALKSLIYFEIVTTVALAIGLVIVNTLQPGVGVTLPISTDKPATAATAAPNAKDIIEHIFPESFFESATNNNVLQVVVFAMLFAVALTQVKGKPKETMLNFFEGVSEVMFKFTGMVMLLAPFGVGAAIAVTVGHSGLHILKILGELVGTLYGALLVFILIVLLPVALLAKIPVRRFFSHVKDPALIAFSTASSAAALPLALENMQKFGVPKRIVAFVLPAGYSFNLDGSTLYLAVASMFVAQAACVHMTLGQQLVMMLTLMLASKGIAAVPRATLVVLSGTLVTFNLPLEAIGLILSVDTLMDMGRTMVNVIGNCLASAIMARWEGELKIPAAEENIAAVPNDSVA
ncbi:MAG TPA: dicarboxylate/amino acid:cation symporter [Candidatus Sulfotelmatobacter sp.]|jgi:proton glutamate symport protein|nr:dicarboxylate/amino acid:cation symporter [Candidatus Sulfotelmatobacter sp.]